MSARQEITTKLVVNGRPVTIKLIHNPLVDDIVVAEAQYFASSLEGEKIPDDYRVARDIRDFLIRLKVER